MYLKNRFQIDFQSLEAKTGELFACTILKIFIYFIIFVIYFWWSCWYQRYNMGVRILLLKTACRSSEA